MIKIHYCETCYESLVRCCHLSAPVVTSDTVTATYVTKRGIELPNTQCTSPIIFSRCHLANLSKLNGILPLVIKIYSLKSRYIPIPVVKP